MDLQNSLFNFIAFYIALSLNKERSYIKSWIAVSGGACYEQRDYRMGNGRGSYKYYLQSSRPFAETRTIIVTNFTSFRYEYIYIVINHFLLPSTVCLHVVV